MNVKKNNQGLILIISLWILAIISLVSISLAHRVAVNLKLTRFGKERMQCLYIAKAAIQKAMNVLDNDSKDINTPDTLSDLWSTGFDSTNNNYIFKDVEVGSGSWTINYVYSDLAESPVYFYGLSDEERKISINKAGKNLLVSMFDLIGASNSGDLADNIIYWREPDTGSVGDYYESPDNPYPARKAAFKTLEELSLVKGFRENQDLIEKCKKYFTVFPLNAEKNIININTASPEVLKAIFIDLDADADAPAGLFDKLVNNIINYREGEIKDDYIYTPINENYVDTVLNNSLTEDEITWVSNQAAKQAFPFTTKSNFFRMDVLAKLNTGKIQKKVTAVIDRSDKANIVIGYWYEE